MKILNFIYRNIICDRLSHDSKIRIVMILIKIPILKSYIKNTYDYDPNKQDNHENDRKILIDYIHKRGVEENELELFF